MSTAQRGMHGSCGGYWVGPVVVEDGSSRDVCGGCGMERPHARKTVRRDLTPVPGALTGPARVYAELRLRNLRTIRELVWGRLDEATTDADRSRIAETVARYDARIVRQEGRLAR